MHAHKQVDRPIHFTKCVSMYVCVCVSFYAIVHFTSHYNGILPSVQKAHWITFLAKKKLNDWKRLIRKEQNRIRQTVGITWNARSGGPLDFFFGRKCYCMASEDILEVKSNWSTQWLVCIWTCLLDRIHLGTHYIGGLSVSRRLKHCQLLMLELMVVVVVMAVLLLVGMLEMMLLAWVALKKSPNHIPFYVSLVIKLYANQTIKCMHRPIPLCAFHYSKTINRILNFDFLFGSNVLNLTIDLS